jgi:hypothetical protein
MYANKKEPQYKQLYVITLCVSMFIACLGYVSYGVLPWIRLRPVLADIGDNCHPPPPTVRYNEGLLYYSEISWIRFYVYRW